MNCWFNAAQDRKAELEFYPRFRRICHSFKRLMNEGLLQQAIGYGTRIGRSGQKILIFAFSTRIPDGFKGMAGGFKARPDAAFDGGGKSRVGPVAC
jgi:hypothetical protein